MQATRVNDAATTVNDVDTLPVVLTLKETAHLLQVPVATFYKWREKGYGPRGHRVGKGIRYERDTVLAWLREQPDGSPGTPAERVTIRPPRSRR